MKQTSAKFLLTALAYIVPSMILGLLWHLVFFKHLYDSLLIYNRAEPIIPLGFASMIIQGTVMAYLYQFFSRDKTSMATAIKFSLIMGAFLFSVSTLANGAKIEVASMETWLLIQSTFHLMQFAVAGILIGIVNRNSNA